MLTSAVVFALLSGVSAATWTICLKLGSTRINAALGAMVMRITSSQIIGGTSTALVLLVGFVALIFLLQAQGG